MADHAAPRLDAAVALVGLAVLVPGAPVGLGRSLLQQALHRLGQRGLVVLDPDDVAGTLVDQLLHDRLLAAHRVHRHRGTAQVQSGQQLRNCGDLVALGLRPDLPQRHALAAVPGRHQVQRPVGRARAAQRLAVDGDVLLRQTRADLRHPAAKAGLEPHRVQHREHPAERVVRCDALLEGQETPQPLQLELAPLAHIDPVLGAGRHRAQRRQPQFLQRVLEAPALPARIVQIFKALHQLVAWGGRRVVWHRVLGGARSGGIVTSQPGTWLMQSP